MPEAPSVRCNFCGQPQDKVTRMFAGPNVAICSPCVLLCVQIMFGPPFQAASPEPAPSAQKEG